MATLAAPRLTLRCSLKRNADSSLNHSKIGAASQSLFGSGPKRPLDIRKIKRDAETVFDEEEAKRERLIEGSKEIWFRRFMAWRGLCGVGGIFEELQIAADMEEDGITWVLASKFVRFTTIAERY